MSQLQAGKAPGRAFRRILGPPLILALVLAVPFGAAGRLDLPFFWATLGIHFAFMFIALSTMDPGLREERLHPRPGGKDRFMRWVAFAFLLAFLIVAGLDAGRFHWSDTVPHAARIAGLAGFTLSLALTFWAMRVNRFFSPVVRIQSERGHHLVTTGPYAYVRHPGYAGAAGASLCSALALGSWWAMAAVAVLVSLFLRRTVIEDRYLHENLEGYPEYAGKVRYRWVPFVW